VAAIPAERADPWLELGRAAAVHPDDAAAQRAAASVHRDDPPAVAAEADRGDAPAERRGEPLNAGLRRLPPRLGVLLRPPGGGMGGLVLDGGLGHHLARAGEERGFAGRGPQVQREDVGERAHGLRRPPGDRAAAGSGGPGQRRSRASGFTTLGGTFPVTPARQFSAAIVAILVRVAVLALPRCGGITTLPSLSSGASIGTGTTSN